MTSKLLVLPEPGLLKAPWLRQLRPKMVLCPAMDAAEAKLQGWFAVPFKHGSLHPARSDLKSIGRLLQQACEEIILGRDLNRTWGYETFYTALGLAGVKCFFELNQNNRTEIHPPQRLQYRPHRMLLKACGGIGNLIQVSCIARSAIRQGIETFFLPLNDANGFPIPELFDGHGLHGLHIIDGRENVTVDFSLNIEARDHLRETDYFHSPFRVGADFPETELYSQFFENVTELRGDSRAVFIGGTDREPPDELRGKVVVCPGSKPGWDSKRWPHIKALLRALDDSVLLCKSADLDAYDQLEHLETIDRNGVHSAVDLPLAQAIAVLRHARAVVANDCGPAHIAAAAGVPTLILFGPSWLHKNRPPGANVRVIALNLDCRPCQEADPDFWPGTLGGNGYRCQRHFACLQKIDVDMVLDVLHTMIG